MLGCLQQDDVMLGCLKLNSLNTTFSTLGSFQQDEVMLDH